MSSESESSVGAESGASYSTVYHPSWHWQSLDLSGVLHQLSEHPRRDGLDIKKDHQSHGQSLLCPDPCVTWGSFSEKSDPGSSILHTLAGFPGPESMLFWNCHSCSSNFILIWFDLFWKSHFFPPILSWFGLTSAYGTGSATGTGCGGCVKPISFDIRFRSFLPLTFL